MSIGRTLAIGLAIALLGVAQTHAQTPQAAAKAVFAYAPGDGTPAMGRTNVSGLFAVVQVTSGTIEGSSMAGDLILLRRFSFGWQALSTIDKRCDLDLLGVPSQDRSPLLASMPPLKNSNVIDCAGMNDYGDSGPTSDVESIRAFGIRGFVPGVVVAGNFGMAEWYGGGGGQTLYRKTHGVWQRIAGGGGQMPTSLLAQYGVPAKDLCKFPAGGCPQPITVP